MASGSLIRPVPKKKEDSLPDYITYFERIADANDWDDEVAAKVFPGLLEVGNRHLDSVSETNLRKFSTIKTSLIGSTEPYRESNRGKLMSAKQLSSESIPEFRDRVAKLVDLVYPRFAKTNRLQLARDFFVQGLPTTLQNTVIISKAEKMEDAVNAAMLAESLDLSRKDNNIFKNKVMSKGSGDNFSAYTCHFCKKKGHIARDCRAKLNVFQKAKKNEHVSSIKNEKSKRKVIHFQIDGQKLECLLDTGASLSILPASKFTATLLPKKRLVLLSGETLENYGEICSTISDSSGSVLCKHEFNIADVDHALIGMDLLSELNATIDIANSLLICDNATFTLFPETSLDPPDADVDVLIADADFEDVVYITSEVDVDFPAESPSESTTSSSDVNDKVKVILKKYEPLFSGVGKTELVQHYINTSDNAPINLPSYRLPMHLKSKAKLIIDDMLKDKIISHSTSEYSSPVILVKKKGADAVRVCIDYRSLNSKTKKDAFTCPRIDDLIDKLYDAKVFTKLDLKSAYHNIEIAPEDRHKTAFRFEGNLYEYNRVPYGLCTAPATFCRLVSQVLLYVNDFTTGFFDDIVIFSDSEDEHFSHVETVLSVLLEAGLKLNPNKCQFFRDQIEYLGFTIGHQLLSPAESKISVIREWPVPKTLKDVKKFLGISGYYRKLIKNFSEIAEPLNALQRKQMKFVWSDACNNSFIKLKTLLASSPVVRIADPKAQFIVKTDASKFGVGCILEQVDFSNNERYVVEYASKRFDKAAVNYPAIEQESFGLIFALKHWSHYLIGKKFIVETDSSTVQWLQNKRDCLGKLGRWSMYLQNFDFVTTHIPGRLHVAPDAISRSFPISSVTDVKDNWSKEIESDPELSALINKKIIKINDLYVRETDRNQIVAPLSVRNYILSELHDKIGHNGIEKTMKRVQERYYWPGLSTFVKKYCKACYVCAVTKDNAPPNSAPLVPINTSNLEPFQMVGMDILGPFPTAVNGEKYLVIMQDYFTKWPEAIALKSVDSDSIKRWLSNEIIPRYGVMSELITDQGSQFVSKSFRDYCSSMGIHCRTTTPFHPMTDGMVEKLNRTFLNMLRAYVSDHQSDWPDHLPVILYSYRTAVHDSIKVSPAEALQTRKLRLPIDLLFQPCAFSLSQSLTSIDQLMNRMLSIRTDIREQSVKSLAKRKKDYDSAKVRKVRETYKPGDRIYWRKPINKKGKCPKLSRIWQGPFLVKSKSSDVNIVITDSVDTCITVHVNDIKICHDNIVLPKCIGIRGRPKKNM